MAISKKNFAFLSLAIFLGIMIGLFISANFDLIFRGFASSNPTGSEAKATLVSEVKPVESANLASANSDQSGIDDLLQLEKAYIRVAEEVKPWVVTITSAKIIRYYYRNPFDDFFDFFGNWDRPRNRDREQGQEREYRQEGLGSGVIVSADGYILTNNHVVQEADEIRVITMDKKEYTAKLIGRDEKTDVAVVKIQEKNLPFARLGDSDNIQVGQIVMAIGNPFSQELKQTVTEGIISAKGRSNIGLSDYEDFIQTTAAINPGNSGGALVNLRGELIGINTAIVSRSGGFNGIGFAIPINMAKHVMDLLIEKGYVVRGYLGVGIQPIDEEMAQALGLKSTEGALISSIEKGLPADKAGLKEQDVVLEMDGKKIKDHTDFRLRIAERRPGERVNLLILRDGRTMTIPVTLGEKPGDRPSKQLSEKETEKLGISVGNLTAERSRRYGFENESGVIVLDVKQGSEAWRKGMREGDLITSINRKPVKDVSDYNEIMGNVKSGDILLIRLKKRLSDNSVSQIFITIRVP
ncbi:MAG: DegQ family serine endoprotease [candidate division KSB1 bacterium]|nr:DegQ family serine endoprotease [candidate division KSB1 bacterium]MDZ7317926.1 DegQ family serine endoprotease [candidate division KSB1 bacterium]MDZ7340697.1 DegQ family serine endoprotease [candidate division KSB1 bacterium]